MTGHSGVGGGGKRSEKGRPRIALCSSAAISSASIPNKAAPAPSINVTISALRTNRAALGVSKQVGKALCRVFFFSKEPRNESKARNDI